VSGALRASGTWRVLLTLLVLAILGITLQSLRTSGASYAAASANPANVFVAGSLSHVSDRNGQVMLVAGDLEPGDSSSGTMTLAAAGTIAGAYTLTASDLVNVPVSPALSGKLDLTIEDVTGTAEVLWEGTVAAFASADLGDIAPGASRTYRLTLDYPDGANDSALQGATMTLVLRVAGVSQ
jgi:hypothetical protein